MSQPIVQCPHCGQTVAAQAAAPGQVLQCPNCRKAFSTPPAGAALPLAPPPALAPQPPHAPSVGYATPAGYGMSIRPNSPASISRVCGLLFFVLLAVNGAMFAAGMRIPIVNGILALIALVMPLLAVIFGIIGLARARHPGVGGKGSAIAGLVMGGVAILLMVAIVPAILLPSLNRARETANRVKCGANLRQIGVAMMMYANENRGAYPPRPEDLLLTQDIGANVFVCPTTNDTPAPGTTPQAAAANLSAGGHDSYIYLGKGKTTASPMNVILVYEPMTDHRQGFNALFGDGHVEFLSGAQAQKVQAELQANQNPPPSYR